MLLKRCYISSFGKLQNFTYDFTEGLNVIRKENGWGKSTFAAFIRAMLYGMPSLGSRAKLEDAERRKYKPWQGGNMGGYLIFEANGKEYKAERTFGAKEGEDTFRLTDLSTNLESSDFSAELGKELFGLDKEAYSRSTYLPQNKISGGGINDSIGRKLGRIAEGDEESGNFEKAYKVLDEIRKKYIPDRQKDEKGCIAELNRSVSETESRLEDCRRKEENAKPWREKERTLAAEKKECREKLLECRRELESAAGYEALLAKKRHYGELCQREERLRQQADGIKSLFRAGVPEPEELKQCRQEAEEAAELSGELRSYRMGEQEQERLKDLREMFRNGVPEERELLECRQAEKEMQECSAQAERLCVQAEREEKIAKKARRRDAVSAAVSFGAAAVFAASAAVCALTSVKLLPLFVCGAVLALAGGVCFLVFAAGSRRKQNEAQENKRQALSVLEDCDKKGRRGREILGRCGMEKNTDVTGALYLLSDCVKEYRQLSEKSGNYARSLERKRELLSRSEQLLQKYGMDGEDISGGLRLLENRVRDLKGFSQELEEAAEKRAQFERENPPEEFCSLTPPEEDCAELQRKEREITERIEALEEEEKDCRTRAEAFEEEAERDTEYEETLLQLNAELSAKKREHFFITETMKCLQTAKDSFSSRYMKGLLRSFQDYMSLLAGEDFEKSMDGRFDGVDVDTNLDIRVSAYGGGKEPGYLSTGFRDLLGLCMRFALVDALFEEEQPFLILDDPFVNLDEEKVARALRFLGEASKKYQIIYFVCHGSRCG